MGTNMSMNDDDKCVAGKDKKQVEAGMSILAMNTSHMTSVVAEMESRLSAVLTEPRLGTLPSLLGTRL